MDHYRIYLRSELGRLCSRGYAEQFVQHVPREWLAANALPADRKGITKAFATQTRVDGFVAGLADPLLVELVQFCGQWRGNDIATRLSPLQRHHETSVEAGGILLSPAEVELVHLFERNDWRLTAIATDPAVLASWPYHNYRRGEPVAFPVCLATAEDARFRIFDGMHRAIQLVRNGEQAIPLCVVVPQVMLPNPRLHLTGS